jgi:hypothetical protein
VIVALTTGSDVPSSVRLPIASSMFPISTSIVRVGKPLAHKRKSHQDDRTAEKRDKRLTEQLDSCNPNES